MRKHRIVVVGTSAGGMSALEQLVSQLPSSFSAPVFIVQHLTPDANAEPLARALGRAAKLHCTVARHGGPIEQGHIYVAPSDNHLLLTATSMLVTKGARENRYRPAIDPLFRSAAVAHGPRVISVVLTGMLDDGTEGTSAVKRCGGTTIVQDPGDAAYPAMPRSALAVKVDHCVSMNEMGALLTRLARMRPKRRIAVPNDIKVEAEIAERVLSDVKAINLLGDQVPYNCPNCGGVLWQLQRSSTRRYRCHTGHSFTAATLLAEQSSKIEETLWISLRMLEERRNLLRAMRQRGRHVTKADADREAEAEIHITRIRELLVFNAGNTSKARRARRRGR